VDQQGPLTWIKLALPKAVLLLNCPAITDTGAHNVIGIMSIQRSLVACVAVVLAASISASFASPCSQEIDSVQAKFDTMLEAQAGAGPSARESAAATMHRQPTPGSIAAAESKLGDVSPEKVQAVEALLTRAREADRVGDQSACEQALAEVRRVFFQ
jgi:hypothetical protein